MTNPVRKHVFVILHKRKAPSGRELASEMTEGEHAMAKFIKTMP